LKSATAATAMARSICDDSGEPGRRGSGSLAGENDKINGNGVGKNRQPQVVEGYEEEEQDEGQGDVGLLKLAGWAVRLFFQDGIGMKKIDEGYKRKKV
jgi:hypothetical protein